MERAAVRLSVQTACTNIQPSTTPPPNPIPMINMMQQCYPRPPTNTPTRRNPTSLRPLSAELSSLSRSDGSASLQAGNTHILCAVHGPMAPRMNKWEKYDRGVVSVAFSRGLMVKNGSAPGGASSSVRMDDNNVDEDATNITAKNQLQQESINQYMKTVPVPPPPGLGSTERELEYFLRDALSSCIILERYPRCVIQVVIQIVQADGSVLGSAVNCALLALMDAGVAMWGLPVASTCVVIPKSCYDNTTTIDEDDAGVETTKEKHDDVIWLDPTAEEEAGAGHAIVVIVTDDTKQNQQTIEKGEEVGEGGIITSFTFGPLSLQGLLSSMKCMKETSSAAMVAFMRLAVEQKVQREVQTLWS